MKKLFMVSLGPGDPELLTLKALNTLKQCDAICIPTKSEDHSFEKSMTYKIVSSVVDLTNKEVVAVYAPMKFKKEDWHAQVDTILESFQEHQHVAFVTLGDAGIYSTVYYLLDIIKHQEPSIYQNCEVIPGITSFAQASAHIKKPLCLGKSSLEIIPAGSEAPQKTTIYMRPKIGANTDALTDDQDFVTFENLNYKGERITHGKIPTIKRYMTLLINFAKVKL